MTDTDPGTTTATPAGDDAQAPRKRGGLSTMLLADLKAMAAGLGIPGAAGMRKPQLVAAIREAQSAPAPARREEAAAVPTASGGEERAQRRRATRPPQEAQPAPEARQEAPQEREASRQPGQQQGQQQSQQQGQPQGQQQGQAPPQQQSQEAERAEQDQPRRRDRGPRGQGQQEDGSQGKQSGQQPGRQDKQPEKPVAQQDKQGGQQDKQDPRQGGQDQDAPRDQDDDDAGSRRNRRRRGRDRDRAPERAGRSTGRGEPDTSVLEDDVVVPAAGILDVLDNYAFVRTSGYLPGPDDVYVSLSMVRKYGLRRGDAVVGQVRQPREGERREKFNPMVRIDSVNGADPDTARQRVDFAALTPVHPTERLRMETTADDLVGRVIDLVAPIGKGQRGLVVSPAKAGKTAVLKAIAAAVTANNPECHLMVVLVDERPEEVTEFERSVKGEVIPSTFDRPPADHTTVAELAIERAKRLVELGHDVVVLLDGLTRLGRAHNLATPASGRVLPGGVDAAALHPPKRFFGAARTIENGGSLTIVATAAVESGSRVDEVILEELEGTANMELRLRRELADRRSFPAVDAVRSGTRREELLMPAEEVAVVAELRRVLAGLDGLAAQEMLVERLRATRSNVELLMQVQKG